MPFTILSMHAYKPPEHCTMIYYNAYSPTAQLPSRVHKNEMSVCHLVLTYSSVARGGLWGLEPPITYQILVPVGSPSLTFCN